MGAIYGASYVLTDAFIGYIVFFPLGVAPLGILEYFTRYHFLEGTGGFFSVTVPAGVIGWTISIGVAVVGGALLYARTAVLPRRSRIRVWVLTVIILEAMSGFLGLFEYRCGYRDEGCVGDLPREVTYEECVAAGKPLLQMSSDGAPSCLWNDNFVIDP